MTLLDRGLPAGARCDAIWRLPETQRTAAAEVWPACWRESSADHGPSAAGAAAKLCIDR